MNKIQISGLILNFIIYLIMILPVIIISFKQSLYENRKKFISYLIFSIILEIILSMIIYSFPKNIFSLFTKTTGLINYATYASKILFISSSLYGIKILVPAYLFRLNKISNSQNTNINENNFESNSSQINPNLKEITKNSYFKKIQKKSAILFFSKIAVTIIFILIGYNFFNTKGILFAIPLTDLLYYIFYIILFLKVISYNI